MYVKGKYVKKCQDVTSNDKLTQQRGAVRQVRDSETNGCHHVVATEVQVKRLSQN